MPNESFARYPAAVALFGFVGGLLFASAASNAAAACAGFAIIAILSAFVRPHCRRELVILFLFAAAGVTRTFFIARPATADVDPQRFSTVEVAVGRGWDESASGFVLSAPEFTLIRTGGSVIVREKIRIYAATPPEACGRAATIRAEGFLKRSPAGGFSLSLKSNELASYHRQASRFDPALWNRLVAAALDDAAGEFIRARRGAALTKALLLGKSRQLPFDILDSYQRGGTYHLLVFSGLQIAAAAAAMRWSLGTFQRPRLVDVSLLGLCAIAPAFVGNEPSVNRAAWMIGLYSLSRIQKRPTDVGNLLFVSALLRVAVYPGELRDAGFLLTYAATGGLILLGRPLAAFAATHRVPTVLAYGAAAEIATAPLSLLFFHRLTIGGSIATIVVTPLLMIAFSLSALAAALLPLSRDLVFALLEVIDRTNDAMMLVNTFSAHHLTTLAPAPPVVLVLLCMCAAAIVAALRSRFAPAVAALLLVSASLGSVAVQLACRNAGTQLQVIDVGQGDAILFREGEHAVLVDGGGRTDDPSFARRVLFPRLLDRGVRRFDVVALSHPHPDHCGGLSGVLREFPVKELWLSRRHLSTQCGHALTEAAIESGVTIRFVEYMPHRTIGPASVEIHAARLRFKHAVENNSSVVYRITAGSRRILLTGDIEKESERTLVGDELDLRADILKVPHHGSRSSSTDLLLNAVLPRVALISCGIDNPFGHPHAEVLEALRCRRIRALRTDENGTITCTIDNGRIFTAAEIDTSR